MKTIGIAGGTGFVGQYITRQLTDKGYNVTIFTRNPGKYTGNDKVSYATLDADSGQADVSAVGRLDGAINLSGAGVADKRWTAARKKEILDSRVNTTTFFINQLQQFAPNCRTFVSASAIGIYGPDKEGNAPFTEDAPPYGDFLGDTCLQWEAASQKANDKFRTCIIRIGIVLGKESGAFREFVKPMRFGIKPILGGGKQSTSWIEVEDLARLFVHTLESEQMNGIYNGVAPNPVSHSALMDVIGEVMGGVKIPIPVPAIFLKIGLGEMSVEILKSCKVSAAKTIGTGFRFNHPAIRQAVEAILDK